MTKEAKGNQVNEVVAVDSSSESLPAVMAELADAARETMKSARAANTVKAYRLDLAHFESWCSAANLEALPADPETLVLFLQSNRDDYAVSTLQRRISAISTAHQVAGHTSPTASPVFKDFWKGLRREKAEAGQTVKGVGAKPITREELRAMMASIPSTTIGKRDRAMLLVGFHGAFRRSELVGLDLANLEQTDQGLPGHAHEVEDRPGGRGDRQGPRVSGRRRGLPNPGAERLARGPRRRSRALVPRRHEGREREVFAPSGHHGRPRREEGCEVGRARRVLRSLAPLRARDPSRCRWRAGTRDHGARWMEVGRDGSPLHKARLRIPRERRQVPEALRQS